MGATLLLLRLLVAGPEPTAQQILEMVDKKLFGHSDDYFRLRVKIGAGSPSDPTIEVFQKIVGGKMMRLVRFLAPADLRGMGVLAQSRDTMYVYLPGFDKVRRIAAHARAQSFMGSDFIYDDLGLISWSPDYVARLVSSTADAWVLDLLPKPDRDPSFARLQMTVSRRCSLFTRIEYFDASGHKLRTHTRDIDLERCEMKHMAMITHGKTDHRTDGEVLMSAFDKGLPDDLFTVRSLARGN